MLYETIGGSVERFTDSSMEPSTVRTETPRRLRLPGKTSSRPTKLEHKFTTQRSITYVGYCWHEEKI